MSDSWDDYAESWDDDKDVVLYSEQAFETLLNAVDIKDLKILDFGCGTGLLTEKMSPLAKHIVALDPSEKMIAVLDGKQLPNVTTVAEPLSESLMSQRLSLSIGFDVVVASSVCAFVPDYGHTLSLIKSLLAPGGVFVQWDWLAQGGDADFGFSEERVADTLEKTGFVIESIDQPFSLDSHKGAMPVLMAVGKVV